MSAQNFRLRLLFPSAETVEKSSLTIGDKHWIVREISSSVHPPSYTCISYIWGNDESRMLNPIFPAVGPENISTHTLPALEAVVTGMGTFTEAFWIDAFCIPTAEEGKALKNATLESMGYIYSAAAGVSVVLAEDSYNALSKMVGKLYSKNKSNVPVVEDDEGDASMRVLESDAWISSVWTYQEVMGSQNLSFLSQDPSQPRLDAETTFNALGYYISTYRERQEGFQRFDVATKFPKLDAFEELGGDWLMWANGVGDKYALQVMANMDGRKTDKKKNYWYARIGALSMKRVDRAADTDERSLADTFMRNCTESGDFSFLFSAAARENGERGWRPRLGELPAVVPSHNTGLRQGGEVQVGGGLILHDVAEYDSVDQSLSPKAILFLQTWNERSGHLGTALNYASLSDPLQLSKIGQAIFEFLFRMGFTGLGEYILLEDGLFFPQHKVEQVSVLVLVSTVIEYVFGRPGIAIATSTEGAVSYVPGVLVGKVQRSGKSIHLI